MTLGSKKKFTWHVMILCQPTMLETLQNVLELVALSLQKRTMFQDQDLQQTADMDTT